MTLADDIERRIRASRLAPGKVFASEQDLQSGGEAGRSVVRQAVRLLEQRGVAYMKRGVGGGLVVKAPDLGAAARNLSIVIERHVENYGSLEALNRATEAFVLLDSVRSLELSKVDGLRAMARSLSELPTEAFAEAHGHRQMVIAMFEAFGDPTINLFQRTSMECGLDLVPWELIEAAEELRGEYWDLTIERVEALIAGDVPRLFAIREAQARFYAASSQWRSMDQAQQAHGVDQARPSSGLKAERLSREILREIRLRGWNAGERLGSFEDLATRYGASASVLREAIRMLEENAAVHMQRGRNGGLIIATPDQRKAVSGALEYLRAAGTNRALVIRHLDQILMEAIEVATRHASDASVEALRADVAQLGKTSRSQQDMYTALANLSGNIALAIAAEVLTNLAWPDEEAVSMPSSSKLSELTLVLDNIVIRDSAKARRAYLAHRGRAQV